MTEPTKEQMAEFFLGYIGDGYTGGDPMIDAILAHLRREDGRDAARYRKLREYWVNVYEFAGDNDTRVKGAHLDAEVDALAAPSDVPKEAQPVASPDAQGEKHAQLFRFYSVDNADALIEMQTIHIQRLQSKLPPAREEHPRNYREG